jgi:hypothetical protein
MLDALLSWDHGSEPNTMTNSNIARVDSVGSERVLKLDYMVRRSVAKRPPTGGPLLYQHSTRSDLR